MIKVKQYIGIDISRATFNVFGCFIGHKVFSNDKKGFKQLMKLLEEGDCVVMEATGAYHQRMAKHLFDSGVLVSVVNPLRIKRYIQMKLKSTKTDKSDARMISLYADSEGVDLWETPPKWIHECAVLQGMVSLMIKQVTQLKNKAHYYAATGDKKGKHMKSLTGVKKRLTKEIDYLESIMESIIKDNDPELLSCLLTIPGVGRKTAIFLIVSTRGLKDFESANQLISFFGMSPAESTSGTTVKGSSSITKAGNPKMRRLLFLSSFSAHRHNPQCKAMYERMVAKGKNQKLALTAVSCKILKQAFAISQSRIPYDPKYRSYRTAV